MFYAVHLILLHDRLICFFILHKNPYSMLMDVLKGEHTS